MAEQFNPGSVMTSVSLSGVNTLDHTAVMRPDNTSLIAPSTLTVSQLLRLVLWFGLLTGLSETAMRGSAKAILAKVIYFDPAIVWMAPVADTFLFSIGILILLLFGLALRRRAISARGALFTLAFLSSLSLLLLIPKLHLLAKVAIAIGLAVQTARFVGSHSASFLSLVRSTTLYLVGIILVMTLILYGWQNLSERNLSASLPPASPNAPNVLLITLDTVRAESMSLYGYAKPTSPQLQQLARSGVTFKQALAPAPWTLASHASMFTGRPPDELSVGWHQALDSTYPTLAGILSQHGYLTAGFVANNLYCNHEFGLNRGFIHYEDYPISLGQIFVSSSIGQALANILWFRKVTDYYETLGRKTAPEINESFLRWLSRNNQRPFFVFLNYFDAHSPYLPPAPFDTKLGPKKKRQIQWIQGDREYTPQEVAAELDAYDGTIAYLDDHVGSLIRELDKRGLRQNTLIIITSDHGEEFHEHGYMGHGGSLYLSALRVPLVILFPTKLPEGKTIDQAVSLEDIPSTVIDLIELKVDGDFPGSSLRRYWDPSVNHDVGHPQLVATVPYAPNQPGRYPASKGDMKSFVVDRYHYIVSGDTRRELYDFADDPLEKRDLMSLPESAKILVQLGLSDAAVAGRLSK
jgi:arylsulfatase A-like enzyme